MNGGSAIEHTEIEWDAGRVSAAWRHPASAAAAGSPTYLALGHGAGGTMQTPGLVAFAEALAARGVGSLCFNFPYAEARRKAPDPQPRLEACYRAVAHLAARRARRLFLGGRSMGGRIASHIVADGVPAAGLVFLGYPLHPPGQPQRLRTRHLPKITVPMLFLQGSRDAFARPDLLADAVGRLPRATLVVVEGADHGLAVRGRAPADVIRELADATLSWMTDLDALYPASAGGRQ